MGIFPSEKRAKNWENNLKWERGREGGDVTCQSLWRGGQREVRGQRPEEKGIPRVVSPRVWEARLPALRTHVRKGKKQAVFRGWEFGE